MHRRLIGWAHEAAIHALQSVHGFGSRQTTAHAQAFARRPDHTAAGARQDLASLIMRITECHATICVVVLFGETNCVVFWRGQPFRCHRIAVIADEGRGLGFGEGSVGVVATRRAALGQIDVTLAIKRNVGNSVVVRRACDVDFQAWIGAEAAIGADRKRPHLRAIDGGIVEPVSQHFHAPDTAALAGIVPSCGVIDAKGGLRDVERVGRVIGHWSQTLAGAALHAVIVIAKIRSMHVQAVDHAGFEVRYEQLARLGIEGDVAKAGAAVGPPAERNIGKESDLTRRAIDAPDASWRATLDGIAPLACHPLRRRLPCLDAL